MHYSSFFVYFFRIFFEKWIFNLSIITLPEKSCWRCRDKIYLCPCGKNGSRFLYIFFIELPTRTFWEIKTVLDPISLHQLIKLQLNPCLGLGKSEKRNWFVIPIIFVRKDSIHDYFFFYNSISTGPPRGEGKEDIFPRARTFTWDPWKEKKEKLKVLDHKSNIFTLVP